jgi:hypothetical protein
LSPPSRAPRGLDAPRVALIERAFELARSGACGSLTEIAKALQREGYRNVPAHLEGRRIRDELRQVRLAAASKVESHAGT